MLDTQNPSKPKKEISEKQLAANRANALLSTGPRTEAGKARVKMDGCVHGMRSAQPILPGESAEKRQDNLKFWRDELGVDSQAQGYLVEKMVDLFWRMDRCQAVETDALTEQIETAEQNYDNRKAEEVDALVKELAPRPGEVVRLLRPSSAGCAWLARQWEVQAEWMGRYECPE